MPEHGRVVILESHPVQYRAPLYREIEGLRPGHITVWYATDTSVRGAIDPGFGRVVKWNTPLLEGYDYELLQLERPYARTEFRRLSGRGMWGRLRRERPRAVLFTQFAHEFEAAAFATCIALRIPIWIRQETQDFAFERGIVKSFVRRWAYRIVYSAVQDAFAIGRLNHAHLLVHGIDKSRITMAPYSVPNPNHGLSEEEKHVKRRDLRQSLGIPDDRLVVGFVGKLIDKKNPQLLLDAVKLLDRTDVHCLFVGDGALRKSLEATAQSARANATFTGFVNQRELPDVYLAIDILILPSNRMGETWGLVVNEALQAGCAVALSDAVGCAPEFSGLDRVRIFNAGDAVAAARAVQQLATFPHSFDWAASVMSEYSLSATAEAIASRL